MKILRSIQELSELTDPISLAIGVFDGIHLGHQAVIRDALDSAASAGGTAVVMTFDPHPQRVLNPDGAPRMITATQHKALLLRDLGVSHLLVQEFTPAFSQIEAADFINSLADACQSLQGISVGREWIFGKGRAGTVDLIRNIGNERGFNVTGVDPVLLDGQIISSTRIRHLIQEGEITNAERFLGRRFTILGSVEHGDHIGRKLGYPTANLYVHKEQLPVSGVYAVSTTNGEFVHRGVVNIGTRPTFYESSTHRLLEVHLLDFEGDLYGEDLEVTFVKFLRPERKFETPEALQTQIAQDIKDAKAALAAS